MAPRIARRAYQTFGGSAAAGLVRLALRSCSLPKRATILRMPVRACGTRRAFVRRWAGRLSDHALQRSGLGVPFEELLASNGRPRLALWSSAVDE